MLSRDVAKHTTMHRTIPHKQEEEEEEKKAGKGGGLKTWELSILD